MMSTTFQANSGIITGRVDEWSPETIAALPFDAQPCYGRGCLAYFVGCALPDGWASLLGEVGPEPPDAFGDAGDGPGSALRICKANLRWDVLLCPEHAKEIDTLIAERLWGRPF